MNPASNLFRTQTICAKIMKVIIDILCTEPIAGFLYRVTIFYTVKRSRHEYTHLFSMRLKLKTQNSKLKTQNSRLQRNLGLFSCGITSATNIAPGAITATG